MTAEWTNLLLVSSDKQRSERASKRSLTRSLTGLDAD